MSFYLSRDPNEAKRGGRDRVVWEKEVECKGPEARPLLCPANGQEGSVSQVEEARGQRRSRRRRGNGVRIMRLSVMQGLWILTMQ